MTFTLKHILIGGLVLFLSHAAAAVEPVKIGSKSFAESVIIGEIASQILQSKNFKTTHQSGLGGTQVVWRALLNGEIDIYPEYTGTLYQDQFHDLQLNDNSALRKALHDVGVGMSEPLGFSNSYAVGMRRHVAERLKIRKISDLRMHPNLRLGFSQEFATRSDGWPKLSQAYKLPQNKVVSMEHELAYRALATDAVDISDLYTTDAEIKMYDLIALEDDQEFFPKYEAIFLYRLATADSTPGLVDVLSSLSNQIDTKQMIVLNTRAKVEKMPESQVSAAFLSERLGVANANVPQTTHLSAFKIMQNWADDRFVLDLKNHLLLVLLPLFLNILVGIPLGIVACKRPRVGQVVLALTGILQTIPSLALLVFMIPLFGIGYPPALCALFLYGLLPIVRNTFTGIKNLPPALMESAQALGLPRRQRLFWIELPLASPQIFAGIKISAVLSVGTATLGAIIGAGGFGEPIMIGIRRNDMSLVLQGAIPAALLAIVIQLLFEVAERFVVPRGLRSIK